MRREGENYFAAQKFMRSWVIAVFHETGDSAFAFNGNELTDQVGQVHPWWWQDQPSSSRLYYLQTPLTKWSGLRSPSPLISKVFNIPWRVDKWVIILLLSQKFQRWYFELDTGIAHFKIFENCALERGGKKHSKLWVNFQGWWNQKGWN